MPTYDYECAACRHRFEALQSISAPPLRKCPACGTRRAHRLIGAGAGLIFKGSGFYITDYRKSGDTKAKTEPKKNVAPTPPNSAGPADTKTKPST